MERNARLKAAKLVPLPKKRLPMSELNRRLSQLRRPRLLIRAARLGLQDYRRERDLKRLIGEPSARSASVAVNRLLELEEEIDTHRRAGTGGYSAAHHVETLIALIAEARLLPRDTAP
jgi:hypothetical protein